MDKANEKTDVQPLNRQDMPIRSNQKVDLPVKIAKSCMDFQSQSIPFLLIWYNLIGSDRVTSHIGREKKPPVLQIETRQLA